MQKIDDITSFLVVSYFIEISYVLKFINQSVYFNFRSNLGFNVAFYFIIFAL